MEVTKSRMGEFFSYGLEVSEGFYFPSDDSVGSVSVYPVTPVDVSVGLRSGEPARNVRVFNNLPSDLSLKDIRLIGQSSRTPRENQNKEEKSFHVHP